MDILIKIYRPNSHPKFPNGGKLTPFLEKLELGDQLDI
jgi:cytochrome-b5 reductase